MKNLITNYDEKAKKPRVKRGMDNFLKDVADSDYELVEGQEWKGSASKMKLECPEHGKFQITSNHLSKGHGCAGCGGNSPKIGEENFHKDAKAAGLGVVKGQKWKNAHTKMNLECTVHGRIQMTPASLAHGTRCAKCAGQSSELAEENFYKNVKDMGLCADESQEWKGNKSKMYVECTKHGKFQIIPSSLSHQGSGCPACADHGFNPSKPACLYFIDQNISSRNVRKFGITNRVKKGHRYSDKMMAEENAKIAVIFKGNGQDVLNAETEIYSRFKKEREEAKKFLGEEKFLGTGNDEIVYTKVLTLHVIKKIAKKHNLTLRPQQ